MSDSVSIPGFAELNLSAAVLKTLDIVGYETPTPIQAMTIPIMLSGCDLLGQAQTGTGKTAAFALPLLSKIDVKKKLPQVLVLTPTRELAIQVAEAFQKYASKIKGFQIAPIYGGQEYGGQLRQLKRGVHVVVGTPGRVMDHIKRKTLKLDDLDTLVLDEADEMLRMGFLEDVEWILEKTPSQRQIALFSATLPTAVKRIAKKYLNDPEEVTIKVKTTTAETINQRYWMVSGLHKLDALTRILEAETFDGMIVFVRTKIATVELAERLRARGFNATALNGDIAQKQRERTVGQLKDGKLDILVATDVAARGLDVERISHVINYDIPSDTESYIHRVGRTGRAGRSGEAILFVSPRERRMLGAIEKATRQTIAMMDLPSTEIINNKRIADFKQRITDTLANEGLEFFNDLVDQYRREHNVPAIEIAAALAKLVQGDQPMLLTKPKKPKKAKNTFEDAVKRQKARSKDGKSKKTRKDKEAPRSNKPPKGMERYRIQVGSDHDVKPANIMGAILNETGLERKHVGQITINEEFSVVDLPRGMPKQLLSLLKKVHVAGRKLKISKWSPPKRTPNPKKKAKKKSKR